jgi:hypothetical protein
MALHDRATAGTMRKLKLRPNRMPRRSVIQPPKGVITAQDTQIAVV